MRYDLFKTAIVNYTAATGSQFEDWVKAGIIEFNNILKVYRSTILIMLTYDLWYFG
jgi:hypothetical protein